jgi:peptidylprolyl isomerase
MTSLKTMAAVAILGWTAVHADALAARKGPPKAPVPAAADFRVVDPENLLVIDTTKGRVIVEMYPEIAPKSVARIKELARAKFYDGLAYHRVINDFMAQGGDPKGDGSGGSDKPNVPAEFTIKRSAATPFVTVSSDGGFDDGFIKALPMRSQTGDLMEMMADGKVSAWGLWCPGVAGMARAGGEDTANSQYYLMRQYSSALEQKYAPWGQTLVGLDVVRSLKIGEPVVNPDRMITVRVMADLPPAQQIKISVLDANSPSFRALVAYDHTQHGGSFSVCDVELPVKTQQAG